MLHIEIEIERPVAALLLLATVAAVILWLTSVGAAAGGGTGAGGPDLRAAATLRQTKEDDGRKLRIQQAVLERREELLRYQLSVLSDEAHRRNGEPDGALLAAQENLLRLLSDRTAGEQELKSTLAQMWDAGSFAIASAPVQAISIVWPVEPIEGVSALFHDASYEARFGLTHEAIDIPVLQGTQIHAPADGVVQTVSDNGTGYSFLILQHDGYATLYGHVSGFLVAEGQRVSMGEVVALTGGRPGSQGAGSLTTGPHLHFEVIDGSGRTDPLTSLPSDRRVEASRVSLLQELGGAQTDPSFPRSNP